MTWITINRVVIHVLCKETAMKLPKFQLFPKRSIWARKVLRVLFLRSLHSLVLMQNCTMRFQEYLELMGEEAISAWRKAQHRAVRYQIWVGRTMFSNRGNSDVRKLYTYDKEEMLVWLSQPIWVYPIAIRVPRSRVCTKEPQTNPQCVTILRTCFRVKLAKDNK